MVKKFIFLVILLLSTSFVFTSNKANAIKNDLQLWTPVYSEFPIKGKFFGYFEVQPRIGDDVSDFDQLIIRPAFGYKLNEHIKLYQGYAWAPRFRPGFRNDNRIWQQVSLENTFKKLQILNALRLEERFIENTGGPSLRTRYTLRFDYPLDKAEKWFVFLMNQLYLNFYTVSNGPERGIEQNRITSGIRRKITKHLDLETGYQYQHRFGGDRINGQIIHALITAVYLNF